jgi:hypothetical protein
MAAKGILETLLDGIHGLIFLVRHPRNGCQGQAEFRVVRFHAIVEVDLLSSAINGING